MAEAYATDSTADSASSPSAQPQGQPHSDGNSNEERLPEVKEDKDHGLLEVRVPALVAGGGGGIRAVFDMREGCLSQLQLLGSMGDGVVPGEQGGRAVDLLGSLDDDNGDVGEDEGEGGEEARRKVMRTSRCFVVVLLLPFRLGATVL